MQVEQISPVPPVVVNKGVELDADTLLQASRRLDWRFLLPDPELGQVACLGTISADLLDSLQLFSDSLTLISSTKERLKGTDKFDVIVVQHLTSEKLQLATKVLRPGGYLYAENEGVLAPKRTRSRWEQWRFSVPSSSIKAVTQANFSEVQAQWHWPNFAACNRIIPLDDQGALLYALQTGSRTRKGKLRSSVGRLLLWTRLLNQSISYFSIVARLNTL